jgi:cellulose synthase/poly-beta-1,6-N-acetylglucosamine synthase-like glycosyltransferase
MRQTFRQQKKKLRLSVLICSLPSRLDRLDKVVTEINRQSIGQDVEILYLGDNKSMSVGEKRNMLMYISSGDYVCFVDDDDMVTSDYIAKIMKGVEGEPDVFCFNVLKKKTMKDGSVTEQLMIHKKQHGKNHNADGMMKMIPGHLNVFRRELAMREPFPNKNLSEDHAWATKILPFIEKEEMIDEVLYIYNDNKGMSETRKR